MEETGRNVSVVTHETRGSETKEKNADLQDHASAQPASNEKQASFVGEDTRDNSAARQEREPEAQPFKKRSGFRYRCYLFSKRTFDLVSSGAFLVIFSWLILLCMFVKWVEDFENPVYISERVGKDGKLFKFYKIRTMCPNAEEMKQRLIEAGLNEADPPAFKMKNDVRVTKVGRVLRKLSLDELLQLINIFNGTMSFVGPRPPIPSEVAQYTAYQRHRLDVKGGLLCLWQISKNRNEMPFAEWVRLDLEYIRRQSLWLDLKIIVKGAYMVLFDRSGV